VDQKSAENSHGFSMAHRFIDGLPFTFFCMVIFHGELWMS
jgi:hypothetical protein